MLTYLAKEDITPLIIYVYVSTAYNFSHTNKSMFSTDNSVQRVGTICTRGCKCENELTYAFGIDIRMIPTAGCYYYDRS